MTKPLPHKQDQRTDDEKKYWRLKLIEVRLAIAKHSFGILVSIILPTIMPILLNLTS